MAAPYGESPRGHGDVVHFNDPGGSLWFGVCGCGKLTNDYGLVFVKLCVERALALNKTVNLLNNFLKNFKQ